MYLAVDVGGSKTLLALFSKDGQIMLKKKFHTDPDYSKFLQSVKSLTDNDFKDYDIEKCCCAIPGTVDRKRGIGIRFGNLDWHRVTIGQDLSRIIGVPVRVEHDAALGGLSEALVLQSNYRRVLYVAPGTGIGVAFIIEGHIDSDLADNEAGHMVIAEQDDQFYTWENLASGRALKSHYGKLASEIDDPNIWAAFAREFARGLQPLIATLQPDIVIVGAGVGLQLQHFIGPLQAELKKRENKMALTPPIAKAKRPEEGVVYGCYEFIRQQSN